MKVQSTLFCGEWDNENIAQKIGKAIDPVLLRNDLEELVEP